MDDLIFTSKTHVARIRVMETTSGLYRGYVYLSHATEGPNDDHPYQTDIHRERYDLALDDAKILAQRLLREFE
ncbi:hypothetical protein [Burkholderia oklahomensis]|uniref:Uncharacterized protein n=1 Tax=Burkholderia oklahomensis TaxID=342113 RepID=A0AAI8BDN8_9BURK|nr:hypothetical protein [Burkholderia oklahomensis]AIO70387.1 hypothetical protein DM82_3813 [Burkholderia oklahomensis]AJX35620.1 hypothetical protein BG90_4229 [Burkholderia oklahomensis C6786]AOI38293.1 hypothetical protein WG70_00755 [Burkholderia oklahomensis EO147]AOI48015.1 hypothetical protein WI23_19095 [Burkholderia oklahomensis C6786]KUY48584.1 hypothetical protein WG70_02900 [Burkholderia oklahomensis EO147]